MTTLLALDATNWRYIAPVPAGTAWRTDAAFDDSSWDVGQTPFGSFSGDPPDNTLWPSSGSPPTIALRRLLGTMSPSNAEIVVGADDSAVVWLNGVEIASKPSPASQQTFAIPDSAWGGDNLLAIAATDDLGGQRKIFVIITEPDPNWVVGAVSIR